MACLKSEQPHQCCCGQVSADRQPAITARQLDVLRTIERLHREEGFPPSVRQLGAELGIKSPNGVADHLRSLARKGLVVRRVAVARGLFITDEGQHVLAQAASASPTAGGDR